MVRSLLRLATQLRTCNDGNLQLAGETLQAPRDVRDFLHTVLLVTTLHQLQVVDNDQTEIIRRFQPARLCPHLHDGPIRRIIDVDVPLPYRTTPLRTTR